MSDAIQIYTEADLADLFKVDVSTVRLLRRRRGWPHFKVGREARFTGEHVEQIVAMHTAGPSDDGATAETDLGSVPSITGLSPRSAGRRRSAS